MLLRVLRRRSLADIETPQELADICFPARGGAPDLSPSLYEVSSEQRIQASTEHAASFLRDPVTSTRVVDLADFSSPIRRTLGRTQFLLTRSAHREGIFADVEAQVDLAGRLLAQLPERTSVITKEESREYIRKRLAVGDDEWKDWLEVLTEGSGWSKLIQRS
mgnify:FL=1|jgi:hypothetical protein